MLHIAILSSSIRTGRHSHRVALYFNEFISSNKLATVEILDLYKYRFPLFEERLRFQASPTDAALEFARKFRAANGIIIVTPEYNGGYPASLKNAVDLLTDDWHRKPVAIATVSDGDFGGNQVITSLLFTLWKMKAWVIPAMFPVPRVQETFDANGIPLDRHSTGKRANTFVQELLWCMEAKQRMAD